MSTSDVFFYSDGLKIAGLLYTPDDWHDGDPPRPGILLVHGISGQKQLPILPTAERLVKEGWFCLAIDHRGCGASEGDRRRFRPLEQVQDAYDALTYMQTLPGIDPDRIGIYGTSFGGGNVIWIAAHDPRVKVVVSSLGPQNGERWLRLVRSAGDWWAFRQEVLEDAERRVRTGEPKEISLERILPHDRHSAEIRKHYSDKGWSTQVEYDMESAEAVMRFRPEWVVDRISPRPVMFISAEWDAVVPQEEQLACYERCGEPKKLVSLRRASHYDTYAFHNPETNALVMREMLAWFHQYLGSTHETGEIVG